MINFNVFLRQTLSLFYFLNPLFQQPRSILFKSNVFNALQKKNTNCKKVQCITFMRSKASNIEVFSEFLQYQTKCLNIFRLETMTEKQTNVT